MVFENKEILLQHDAKFHVCLFDIDKDQKERMRECKREREKEFTARKETDKQN